MKKYQKYLTLLKIVFIGGLLAIFSQYIFAVTRPGTALDDNPEVIDTSPSHQAKSGGSLMIGSNVSATAGFLLEMNGLTRATDGLSVVQVNNNGTLVDGNFYTEGNITLGDLSDTGNTVETMVCASENGVLERC